MPTLNAVKMDGSELKKQPWTSETSKPFVIVDLLSGIKNKDEETKAAPQVDEYPDGGLAAWCIVLGVSPPTISSFSEFYRRVLSCSLRAQPSRRKLHPALFVRILTRSNYTTDSVSSTPGVYVYSGPLPNFFSWLIAEIGVSILLRTSPSPRDPNLNDVSGKFLTLGFRSLA